MLTIWRRTILLLMSCAACGGTQAARPTSDDGPTRSPPSTAQSSVGVLLVHATELGLDRPVVRRYEALDEAVTKKNAELERQLATLDEDKPHPPPGGDGARHGGMRGGGMRAGGMRAGGMGGGQRQGRSAPGVGPGPAAGESRALRTQRAEEVTRLRTRIVANDSAALAEALELLDGGQRDHARAVLDAAGIALPEVRGDSAPDQL